MSSLAEPKLVLGLESAGMLMTPEEFDAAFARIKEAGIPYGDSFHDVGNMRGPGNEFGARGMGAAVYLFDPNQHLIEIRHY